MDFAEVGQRFIRASAVGVVGMIVGAAMGAVSGAAAGLMWGWQHDPTQGIHEAVDSLLAPLPPIDRPEPYRSPWSAWN